MTLLDTQPRLSRPAYILRRFAETLLSVTSRFINAIWYKGSTYQSLSARCYWESLTSVEWSARRDRIDWWFLELFGEEDHCLTYAQKDIEASLKALNRVGLSVELMSNRNVPLWLEEMMSTK